MRLVPVGLAGAAILTAGAILLRRLFTRGEEPAPSPGLDLRHAGEAALLDRLRERGF